jgi:non-specific protein-tyrosine kinase
VEGGVNYISVVEPATVPTVPISPRVGMTVILGSAIGLVLAVGGAFLIEYLDDTIKTSDDVARTADLPTLARIARIDGGAYPEKLIALHHPLSPTVEAYRLLRANLQFSAIDRPLHTLMVNSPGPGEGKSVTLANLAVVMAQSGLRVVAVDADLRRPVLHQVFGLPNSHGLSDAILQTNPPVGEHLQPTEVENLWLLASGPLPPNPAELLGSDRMAAVIEELQAQADMVLLDSPPVLVVADALILSNRVDGVLLVNDAGRTRRSEARHAAEEFRRVRANLLGVVLNRLPRGRGGYYRNHYHYYRSEDGQREERRWRSWLRRLRRRRPEPGE